MWWVIHSQDQIDCNDKRMDWKVLPRLATELLHSYNSWTPTTTKDRMSMFDGNLIEDYFIQFWKEKLEEGKFNNFLSKSCYDDFWDKFIQYIPLVKEYSAYLRCGVFGFMSRDCAQRLLCNEEAGTFVIRFGSNVLDVPIFSIKIPKNQKNEEYDHQFFSKSVMNLLQLRGAIYDPRYGMKKIKLCNGTIMDPKNLFPEIILGEGLPGYNRFTIQKVPQPDLSNHTNGVLIDNSNEEVSQNLVRTLDKVDMEVDQPAVSLQVMPVVSVIPVVPVPIVQVIQQVRPKNMDVVGNVRGGCTICGEECEEYYSDNGANCTLCDCAAAKHPKKKSEQQRK